MEYKNPVFSSVFLSLFAHLYFLLQLQIVIEDYNIKRHSSREIWCV